MKPQRDKMRIPAGEEVLQYARRFGLRRTFYRSAYVLANKVIALSMFDCLHLRLEDVNSALVDAAGRYECRFLALDEVERFVGELDRVSERVALEAATRGDACYAVLDGERLANLALYAPRPTPVLNDLMVHFDPPYWYMYGAFTPPPYRGRRLHALGVLGGALELFDRGVPELVTVYERTNYASMVSALRMGWKPCGRLSRIGIGPWVRHGRTAETHATGMRLERRKVGGPGLTGTDLPDLLTEERRIMNLWAPDYDFAALSNAYIYRIERSQFVKWVMATLREAGRDPRTLSVLDAGCGTGDVIERLSREGVVNLTGLDLADGMLEQARKREVVGARWVEASIEDPPFRGEAFDVIVACFTVHHLLDPSAFFRLVELTLRPGGWFFLLEYDARSVARGSSRRGRISQAAGDLVRAAFARKNRHVLAAQPTLPRVFNPAHRLRGFDEIIRAIEHPEEYELRHEPRGVLLPALLPVLVEESAFDRTLARWAGAVDRKFAPRIGGVFQWFAGRRRS